MSSVSLTNLEKGIDRLRVKGGADPKTLYDFVNGYVTLSRTLKGRGGTSRKKTLPAGTKGLTVFASKLVVFHHSSSTGTDANVTVIILRHPTDGTSALKEIHLAEPFLQYLYVVAEYMDGLVRHFWLQAAKTWTANTTYVEGDVVEPTTPNGYAYKAKRLGTPIPAWAANTARALTNVVVPTVPNGYKYTVTAVTGANPASGSTEPVWPAIDGATVMEGTDITSSGGSSGGTTGGSTTGGGGTVNLPPEVIDRYLLDGDSELR